MTSSASNTYGLEYALFFGIPKNRVELIHGRSPLVFPFDSRESAEAHYAEWIDTICRWKKADPPNINKTAMQWQANVAGFQIELFPRPIHFDVPIAEDAYLALHHTFNRRDFWPGQPAGLETGWDHWMDEGDVRMNLWKLFQDQRKRHGGQYSTRVDIALSDSAALSPDAFYYREGRKDIMIEDDYFGAAPDLIAEVSSASTRALDRGLRMEVYRRAGVEHFWLLDPALETVDVYRLSGDYEHQGRFAAGESFGCDLFPGETISVDALFDTQRKRRVALAIASAEQATGATGSASAEDRDEPEPIPEWLLPPDFAVGLEYFFLLGHPDHRWEFWNNKAYSVLAFGSPTEARARLDHFIAEACRWEGLPTAKPTSMSDDADRSEIGRFQFTRRGRLVWMDLAIDGRRYKDLLRTWTRKEAWDWGEEQAGQSLPDT
jgi:Uma2 family endonuclease